jgi:glycosyltransferase involved in cell wall biosynthesis
MEALVEALDEQMECLVICLSHSWGGLEQVAANDALDVAGLGLDVRVLCLEGSPIHESLAKHAGKLKVVPLNFRPRDHFDFKMRHELMRLIDEGVNLIHLHQTSLLGSVVPWLWSRPGIAVLASRHIMNNHDKRGFYHRAIYRRLDSLLVVSQTLKQNVLDTHPLRERQVRVVNLGLDFERFDPSRVDPGRQRALWGADRDTIVIGLVGRIDPAKGQATFIRAAAGLMKGQRSGEKFKFVMVGEETLGRASTHLQELKEMVTQFHLDERVIFAGYQENIPEVMRAFDIVVMPSRQEAFGLVAIEAMAMECPIVISSGGSAAEIVGDQEYGLLMRPEDAFDLQRQLRALIDQPKLRKKMGTGARAHVVANYDRKIRLHKTLEIYERSLRRRSHF